MNQNLEMALTELASKLGTTVEKLYELTIKQAKIELIKQIITGLSFIVLVICLIWFSLFVGHHPLTIGEYHDLTGWGITAVGCAVLLPVVFFILIFNTGEYIGNIITLIKNPEYWAFNDIVSLIKE